MTFLSKVKPLLGLSIVASGLWLSSCKPEEDLAPKTQVTTPVATPGADESVNDWILRNMREVYYWNDKIPATPNKNTDPSAFFSSLLYKFDATARPDGDRFSWIQESADELTASLNGEEKTTGVEFTLFLRTQGSDEVIAQVLYVHPGSPAAQAGIKRGDIIYKVNGQRLTRGNYSNLLFRGDTYNYGFANVVSGSLQDTDASKTVTARVLQQDPVLLDSVYVQGGKTIGYLVYNQFVPGPNGTTTREYDRKLDNIFGKFKARGVNELVLDLRYNPGGAISSSINLASLIAKGASPSKVFARTEYNKQLMDEIRKQNREATLNSFFQAKSQNIGDNLSRVIVLTTSRTASASEMIINGLKPFMTVTTIGTKTVGKNVGSFTVKDDTKKIKWGMQPIVLKIFNSAGQSDYTAGFSPSVEIREPLALKPLGDITEPLLNEALFQITGDRTARRASRTEPARTEIGSSIERKAGGSNMFDDTRPFNF